MAKKAAGRQPAATAAMAAPDASPPGQVAAGAAPAAPSSAAGVDGAEVTASLVLGRAQICLDEALALGRHSIVDLNRGIGDPVDVVIGGKVVARGEVVTVDAHFGVRITEVLE